MAKVVLLASVPRAASLSFGWWMDPWQQRQIFGERGEREGGERRGEREREREAKLSKPGPRNATDKLEKFRPPP